MRLLDEGLQLRQWPTRAVLRFDDFERLDGRTLRARGRAFRLPEEIAQAVRLELDWVAPRGGLEDARAAVGQLLSRPHGARRTAERLLSAAAQLGASDVHLEADAGGWAIRVRLAGDLHDLARASAESGTRLVAALKGLAGVLPYRSDVLQEGRIPRSGVCADVRASFAPTAMGERAALRLFGRLLRLGELGLGPGVLDKVERALEARTGLMLVAGSTGAGKTTTLYAALEHLARTRRGAHLSLEDPVEQRLRVAGIPVDQIEIEPSRGLTSGALLAAALRQDVDVIAVGEIRTPADARLALEAAHTGRLVLAGVHAGSPAEARQRLVDLGADPALLDAALRGVLFQELETVDCGCGAGCERCRGALRVRRLRAELQLGEGGAR